MRIVVINPNSSEDMTRDMDSVAQEYAQGRMEVVTLATPGAPPFIDTFEDKALAAPGMMQLVRQWEDKADAFVVACHSDPNLELLKEISAKPVVGICEASIKIASMLGDKFSVISPGKRSIPNKAAMIRDRCCMGGYLASVRAPQKPAMEGTDMKALLMPEARRAVEKDGAEVIVLGCAGMVRSFHPRLMVSAYHRSDDLINLPLLIRSLYPGYRMYLRHHPYVPAWETNFYCVAEE